ncbi:MAG TPA: AAA family ATPase, partial [Polyangiales bacterium]|nr:AAA family ATPase [Polyangiales bacterium]
ALETTTQCLRCQADNDESALRCGTCGATMARKSALPSAPTTPRATPERREVTLMFADLGGYTELNQQADVEEVAAIMDAIKDGAAEIIQTYGGMVNQFVGDEVMAVFGLPQGHDDDPRRAVSAALELHAFMRSPRIVRLSRGRRELAFHTGIETGLVLAQSRDFRDGMFDLTGTTVNLAARLRSAAERDEILVGETTQRRVAGFFRSEALAPRLLKGIGSEVTPYRVQAPHELRSSFDLALERGLTPYVGRRSELATLEGYLAEAGRGEARLVSVMGPPGVGKTRLLHELVRRARERGFIVLRGQCQSYGTIPPFQPFLETLEDAVGLRSDGATDAASVVANVLAIDPELERHLPVILYLLALRDPSRPLPAELNGQSLRRAVIAALGAILVAHAGRRPVLVVVEDWHWADEASDTLFVELARATMGHPIMAVLTYRSDQLEVDRRPISNRQLALGQFDEAGTGALLRELLHAERLPDGLARAVQEIADGNPFFVEEVAHALVESGALVHGDAGWTLSRPLGQLGVPHSVQATVRARIDRLAREDKELLKLASVIGAEFSHELLEPLCEDRAGLAPSLERLQERAHILPAVPAARGAGASYRFKHPIVHDVVYDILLLQRRRELHGQIARAIEGEGSGDGQNLEPKYEALAHHYGRSEARERAAHYAALAGFKAERSFSLEQARRQFQAALEHLDQLEPSDANMHQRVELSLRWAAALVHNPAPGQLQVLQRSLEYALRLGDGRNAARCHSWMGWVEYTLGNLQGAIAHNQRGSELCDSLALDDRALRWRLLANIGASHAMAARP